MPPPKVPAMQRTTAQLTSSRPWPGRRRRRRSAHRMGRGARARVAGQPGRDLAAQERVRRQTVGSCVRAPGAAPDAERPGSDERALTERERRRPGTRLRAAPPCYASPTNLTLPAPPGPHFFAQASVSIDLSTGPRPSHQRRSQSLRPSCKTPPLAAALGSVSAWLGRRAPAPAPAFARLR